MIRALPPPTEGSLRVLYADDSIVAVSKPSGLLVHRTRQSTDDVFLLQMLRDQLDTYLFPVHRLDRATSGVIVFALTSDDAHLLQQRLGRPETIKQYLALVRGSTPEEFSSDRPLTGDNGTKQEARTDFERLGEFYRCSLVRARLHTGRRHQIRRHLAHLAHHVIGDTSYGKGRINRALREEYGLPRMFLHARRLQVPHPRSDKLLTIEDPLAPDLADFLLRLPDFDERLLDSI